MIIAMSPKHSQSLYNYVEQPRAENDADVDEYLSGEECRKT